MRFYLSATTALLVLASTAPSFADTRNERLENTTTIVREIMTAPDQTIPRELLDQAHCVVIVPGLKSGAFMVGGKYGRGYAACRSPRNIGWGPPAAVRIEGGSFGFQIGGSETDLLLLVMNQSGMKKLLESKFTLGGQAEVAAGPVGRSSTAQTDAKMTAKILSYSRTRGVFAGVSLQGATLRQDLEENQRLYGRAYSNKTILQGHVPVPRAASELVSVLNHYSRMENRDS
jgi:lipid-binding SYLF domain-containing protein